MLIETESCLLGALPSAPQCKISLVVTYSYTLWSLDSMLLFVSLLTIHRLISIFATQLRLCVRLWCPSVFAWLCQYDHLWLVFFSLWLDLGCVWESEFQSLLFFLDSWKESFSSNSDHLLTNSLLYPNQTACRAGHGTETTLLKIVMCGLFCLCCCAQAVCEMVVTCSLCMVVSVWSSMVYFVFAARIRLRLRWRISVVFAWFGQCG